jgi:hypothetical protein
MGRVIQNGNSTRENPKEPFDIDLEKIDSGLYFLCLEIQDTIHSFRFILN